MEQKLCKFSKTDLPQFETLAELALILNDLEQVLKTLTRCLNLQKSSNDLLLIADLYISGLITYARCFGSGKRNEKLG